jgi:hypothetical protein
MLVISSRFQTLQGNSHKYERLIGHSTVAIALVALADNMTDSKLCFYLE